VPDFDVPVLQANGWTTYSTVAGKTTITMLPPANAVYNSIMFNNRTYVTTPGMSIEASPFDVPMLQANGWTLVLFQADMLQTLTLSAATFRLGDPGLSSGTSSGHRQGPPSPSIPSVRRARCKSLERAYRLVRRRLARPAP
jgi:hypothetical protein